MKFLTLFIPKQFPADSTQLDDIYEYHAWDEEDIYDITDENLDYWNITMNLNHYFLYGRVKLSNESNFRNDTLTFWNTVNFNGVYYDGTFYKCFEVSTNINLHRNVKGVYLYYNMKGLLVDLDSDYPLEVTFIILANFFLHPTNLLTLLWTGILICGLKMWSFWKAGTLKEERALRKMISFHMIIWLSKNMYSKQAAHHHISRPKKQRCKNHTPIFQDNISPKAKGKDDSNHNVIT